MKYKWSVSKGTWNALDVPCKECGRRIPSQETCWKCEVLNDDDTLYEVYFTCYTKEEHDAIRS